MTRRLSYIIKSQMELNLSFMPFIKECGLFIPTFETFKLGEALCLELQLPDQLETQKVDAEVVWITPPNALYQVYQGVGVQFTGEHAKSLAERIKSTLDNTMDIGGYTLGLSTPMMSEES